MISRIKTVGFYLLLAAGALIMIVPFVWMLSSSFKTSGTVFNYPPEFIPRPFTFSSYVDLFYTVRFGRWYLNSVFVSVMATGLALFFSSLAGFGFAKYDFRGKKVLFAILLASLVIPFQVVLIPLFVMMIKMRWMDTYTAIIVPFMAPAFGIFLMRQFMVGIPNELMDAARIDGCSEFGIYWRVILPVARPGLGALTIFQFMQNWNNFLWPLVVLRSAEKYTLPIGLANLFGIYQREYGMIMAGSVLVGVPIIVLFVTMQKQFIAGITLGSVKG